MQKTLFAGLTQLDPTDPLSTDDFSFQAENPLIEDRLLQVGAVTHRHDAHEALANPSTSPSAAAYTSGGAIPGDLSFEFGYTLIDQYGGETEVSPIASVTTQQQIAAPSGALAATADYTAGQLRAATYYYARTFIDGGGGETPLGAMRSVDVEPGHVNARVLLSGLSGGMVAVGAAGWRLYRARDGGNFTYLASGSGNTLTDDGTLCPDCSGMPPEFNTTQSFNRIEVTIPPRGSGAPEWRLYGTVQSGIWGLFSLAGSGTGSGLATVVLTDFVPDRGRPPARTRALRGAAKIDPDTDILDWHWLRPVDDFGDLPSVGNASGDARVTLSNGHVYTWIDGAWGDRSGGGGGGGPEAVDDYDSTPASGSVPLASGANPGVLDLVFDVDAYANIANDAVDDMEFSFWLEGGGLADIQMVLLAPGVTSIDDPNAFTLSNLSGASGGTASGASARAHISHHADRAPVDFPGTFSGLMKPAHDDAFLAQRGKQATGQWKVRVLNWSDTGTAVLRIATLHFRRGLRREGHTFTIMGDVPASGTTRIPAMPVAAHPDAHVRLVKLRHKLASGFASGKVQCNGTDILTGLAFSTAATTVLTHKPVEPDDELELVITAISGSPKGLSCALHIEATVPPGPL